MDNNEEIIRRLAEFLQMNNISFAEEMGLRVSTQEIQLPEMERPKELIKVSFWQPRIFGSLAELVFAYLDPTDLAIFNISGKHGYWKKMGRIVR